MGPESKNTLHFVPPSGPRRSRRLSLKEGMLNTFEDLLTVLIYVGIEYPMNPKVGGDKKLGCGGRGVAEGEKYFAFPK